MRPRQRGHYDEKRGAAAAVVVVAVGVLVEDEVDLALVLQAGHREAVPSRHQRSVATMLAPPPPQPQPLGQQWLIIRRRVVVARRARRTESPHGPRPLASMSLRVAAAAAAHRGVMEGEAGALSVPGCT